VDLGIDRGDTVRINSGAFKGYHQVVKRISPSILSLDIPDALIVAAQDIDYVIFPEELALGHDAMSLRRENINLLGTDYLVPSGLNTKTDIDFSATTLRQEEVKALLLVDVGIAGGEIQAITDADLDASEVDVATPPAAPVTRDHSVASAALKRTDNLGPTVTDAFAI